MIAIKWDYWYGNSNIFSSPSENLETTQEIKNIKAQFSVIKRG